MDRNGYTSKYLNILNIQQFWKLYRDLNTSIEARFQRAVRKIKDHLSKQEYMRIYQTGSAPAKFYKTAKKDKITVSGTTNYLLVRPIVSNIGAASYQLEKIFVQAIISFKYISNLSSTSNQ